MLLFSLIGNHTLKETLQQDCSLLKNKKLWLFDLDGTVYLTDKLYNGAIELFDFYINNNINYVFITNNSSLGTDKYVKKINKLGIKATKKNFYTSVDATISLLKKKYKDELIYAQGTKSFIKTLKKADLNVITKYNDDIKCVIVGFDNELTTKKLETTCRVLRLDVPFYATHLDLTCPSKFGLVPDCGSMCFAIENATGKKPIAVGKPSPSMIIEAMKVFNVKKEDAIVVGDMLDTDIMAAKNSEVDSVLLLSGGTDIKIYQNRDIKANYILKDIEEILNVLKNNFNN